MYDFCFTFPYALLLGLGGFLGWAAKGSLPSLFGGLGSAAILAACAQLSLNAYHQVILLTFKTLCTHDHAFCKLQMFTTIASAGLQQFHIYQRIK